MRCRPRSSRCSRPSCVGRDRCSPLELLEHAWDYAYENRSNVVDVYVRYLRDKIDRPFGVRPSRRCEAPATACREDGSARVARPAPDPGAADARLRPRDGHGAGRYGSLPLLTAGLRAGRADRARASRARRRRGRTRPANGAGGFRGHARLTEEGRPSRRCSRRGGAVLRARRHSRTAHSCASSSPEHADDDRRSTVACPA